MERPDFVLLLDIYGELLSAGQREALDMRYNADLSLSEMAEELGGVSRQSASCSVKNGERKLVELEEKLGFAARLKTLSKQLETARALLGEIHDITCAAYDKCCENGINGICDTTCEGRFEELDGLLKEVEKAL